MKKKLLTIDDLVMFCSSNGLLTFDANNTGYQISVQIPSECTFAQEDSGSMLFGKVKLLHTGLNRNKSNVTEEAAQNCLSGIKYKPVLANFCEIDGVRDFTSHDMEIGKDGEIEYIEHQVGCFTSDEPYMEYDEETGRYYVYANVAIPRNYTDAAEIIERKEGTKVSSELFINKMSFDAEKKELLLEDIEVMGVTLLGKNPDTGADVKEGMEGARLDIADFSIENNSITYESTLRVDNEPTLAIQAEYATENSKKGGETVTKFEELLSQYGKTVEEITFEYEGLSDEELETAFAEAFKKAEEPENSDGEPEAPEEPQDTVVENEVKYSVTVGENTKEFALSLNEVIYALSSLVNDTYGESDNDWYSVQVYAEDNTVVMHGWTKSYRQKFESVDNVYSLVGDRVEVFAQYLTSEEIEALDKIKADFSVVSEKLAKYESEPQKMNILNSKDYEQIADTEEFKNLAKQENHFDLSIEEVSQKADAMLLAYAKNTKLQFAQVEEPKPVVDSVAFVASNHNASFLDRILNK